MKDVQEIISALVQFRNERDWEQFHNPKDLALKMSEMLNSDKTEFWKANSRKASKELSWEKETEALKKLIQQIDG